jgi:transposase-like protein
MIEAGIVNLTGGGLSRQHRGMNRATNPYAGFRYPAEILSYAVWLYFRFTLSFHDIERFCVCQMARVSWPPLAGV